MSLYDAMPAVWKNCSPDERRSIMRLIDGVYRSSSTVDGAIWTHKNVLDLAKYVPLDQVFKLRACYFAAKKDSSVITRVEDESRAPERETAEDQSAIESFVQWWPSSLGDKYVQDRSNRSYRDQLFSHLCNTVAQKNWDGDAGTLQPSSYLDVCISRDQKTLLNPSYKNVLRGFILYDCKGRGAQQKIAQRRLDMISGNISSYSRCLNDSKRLREVEELNGLTAAIANVSADVERERASKRQKRDEANKKRLEKQMAAAEKEKEKKENAILRSRELLRPLVCGQKDASATYFGKWKKTDCENVLKYCYELVGNRGRKKEEICNELETAFQNSWLEGNRGIGSGMPEHGNSDRISEMYGPLVQVEEASVTVNDAVEGG